MQIHVALRETYLLHLPDSRDGRTRGYKVSPFEMDRVRGSTQTFNFIADNRVLADVKDRAFDSLRFIAHET